MDPTALVPEVRNAAWSVNSNLPLFRISTLEEILAGSLSQAKFTLVMLTIAAGTALFLGIVGVYGVISYVVAQRTREIGLRMALGARPADVRRMVVRQGGALGVAGILVGLTAAAGLAQLMSSLLFNVSPLDPATYAILGVLLGTVVLLASYLPARRAASVDPTYALRWE